MLEHLLTSGRMENQLKMTLCDQLDPRNTPVLRHRLGHPLKLDKCLKHDFADFTVINVNLTLTYKEKSFMLAILKTHACTHVMPDSM